MTKMKVIFAGLLFIVTYKSSYSQLIYPDVFIKVEPTDSFIQFDFSSYRYLKWQYNDKRDSAYLSITTNDSSMSYIPKNFNSLKKGNYICFYKSPPIRPLFILIINRKNRVLINFYRTFGIRSIKYYRGAKIKRQIYG